MARQRRGTARTQWALRVALVALAMAWAGSGIAPQRARAAVPATVVLPGSAVPLAALARQMGTYAASAQMSVTVELTPQNGAGVDALVAALYDPHNARYHHWLTTGQFAKMFGPTTSQKGQVADYFTAQHVRVAATDDPFALRLTGTTGEIAAALHTSIADYRLPDGTAGYANAGAIALPRAVAADVTAVLGLSTLGDQHSFVVPMNGKTDRPHYGGAPNGAGLTPQQVASIYGMGAVRGGGAGTTLALFELSSYNAGDIATYVRHFGLRSVPVTTITTDGGPLDDAGALEAEMDVELATGLANGANRILVYNGPNTTQGLVDQYRRIANDNLADVVSTSWGQCEADTAASTRDAEYLAFAQMAAQGQSLVAAAGDNGAFDCLGTGGSNAAQVDDPASQPYATGVGGTSFYHTYDPGTAAYPGYPTTAHAEYVWNTNNNCTASSCAVGASGGGVSQNWSRPSYQKGATGGSHRTVPDVAIDGDPYSGYGTYCTVVAGQCSFDKKTPAGWFGAGGTSAAATVWAVILARVDGLHHNRLGLLNFAAYGLRGDFRDLVGGSPAGIPGGQVTRNGLYAEGAGYDMATGLGSPRVAALLRDLP